MQEIRITKQEAGWRLDRFLEKYLAEAPKSFIYKMLRKKNITLNGSKVAGMERIAEGDCIKLFLAEETIAKFRGQKMGQEKRASAGTGNQQELPLQSLAEQLKSEIIYEDSEILVVNKPQGILSQKAKQEDISLLEYIYAYLQMPSGGEQTDRDTFRPGICNRLDRNTTGLVVAGKSVHALQWMNQLFQERALQKYYWCIVAGTVPQKKRINGYLYKDSSKNTVQIVGQQRKGAVAIQTEYEPLQYGSLGEQKYTLLRVHLITGKSHQIRAHLSSIGYPLVGDHKYGKREINQEFSRRFGVNYQLLHARELYLPEQERDSVCGDMISKPEPASAQNITMPEQYARMHWTAPLPEQFQMVMQALGM